MNIHDHFTADGQPKTDFARWIKRQTCPMGFNPVSAYEGWKAAKDEALKVYVVKTPSKIKPDVVFARNAQEAESLVNNKFRTIIDDEAQGELAPDELRVSKFQGYIDAAKNVREVTNPCFLA